MSISDIAAFWGAILATVIAAAQLISWIWRNPRLYIEVLPPGAAHLSRPRSALAVACNTGSRPVVIKEITVTYFDRRWFPGEPKERAVFDERVPANPAVKLEPIEGKPNHSRPVPNVIYPGEEFRGPFKAFSTYDASKHWLKVEARVRGSNRRFSGWAAPQKDAS